MPDRRRHVLFVIVGIATGTGTICTSLGRGLRKYFGDEFKVSLLTFRPDAKLPQVAENFDETFTLASHVSQGLRELLQLPGSIIRMHSAISEIRPDLVMAIGTFSNIVTSLAIQDAPVVLSDHLNLSERLSARGAGLIARPLLRAIYRRHAAVGVSQAVTEDLRENFDAKKAVAILNGVDGDLVRARSLELPEIEPPKRYIVSVGRLDHQKDPATLIRAFAMARANGLPDELVLVGDGPLRREMAHLAMELDVRDGVHFLGQQVNPFPYVRGATIFAMSSIYEGFGLAMLEAMALGIPCVSTDCPSGPAEVLGGGEFGLLVPMRDPKSLAAALLHLSTDLRLHEQFNARSIQRAEQLSLKNMTAAYRNLFIQELNSLQRG